MMSAFLPRFSRDSLLPQRDNFNNENVAVIKETFNYTRILFWEHQQAGLPLMA